MSEKTGHPMFIESLGEQHPSRALLSISLDYTGFRVLFDLPCKRKLEIEIVAFAKENSTIEVYEHLKGSEPGRYWLINSNHYIVSGTDHLPLLKAYLRTAIGGIENSYEGSFAELILAQWRKENGKDE